MRVPLGSVSLLAIALLMLLPFVDFSCKNRKIVTLNGYEAAFGKKFEADFPLGEWLNDGQPTTGSSFNLKMQEQQRDVGNKWVMFAFLAAVGGGVLSLGWRLAGSLGGFAAVVLYFIAQSDIQKQIQVENVQLLVVNFTIGFWACIIAAAVGAVLCLMEKKK